MESKLEHHQGDDYQEDPHKVGLQSAVEGEEEHHGHDKKSVLKKVKAKAKKIKDTITKHGHGHGDDHEQHHDYQHDGHVHDDVEFDEEDEEMVQDPELHGAPIYESTVIRTTDVLGQEGHFGQHGGNLGRETAVKEDRPVEGKTKTDFAAKNDPVRSSPSHTVLEDLEEDPHAPKDASHGPEPGNYQSKVTDPTGQNAQEASGITSILQSFNKMSVFNKPASKSSAQNLPTSSGSHDQFSPELSPPTVTIKSHENPEEESQSSHRAKLALVTSALAGTAVSAKNAVASKLGYGEHEEERNEKKQNVTEANKSSYTEKVSSATSAVADKAIHAKNVIVSRLGYGGGKEENMHHEGSEKITAGSETENTAGCWVEKLKPGEEDKALSEMISDVLHISKKREAETEEGNISKSMKERISDGLHKREGEEVVGKEKKPTGKVTESEEVARRLGTEKEKSEVQASAENTVADTIKSAVSSWWSGGQSHPQASHETEHGKLF